MRVSDKMIQAQLLTNLNKNRSEISDLQTQAASLKKITKPSDDPTGVSKVMQNKTEVKNLEQFDKNIFYAKTFLDISESTLASLGEALVRAKELAIQASSDSNSGMPRELISSEISQIRNSVIEMGNRRFGDRYVFGGYKTTQAPFDKEGKYSGDDNLIQVQNMHGQFVPLNIVGSEVFLGLKNPNEGILRGTKALPRSLEELQQFKLEQVEEEFVREEKLKENEDKAVQMRGPASADRVQRLEEPVVTMGSTGVNIFATLEKLDHSMKSNDKVGIQETLDALDQAFNQVNMARADIGGRQNQLLATSEGIQRNVLDTKAYNSQIEDADVFKVMTDLNKANSTLQATLQTSSKFANQSLLDFLK